MIGGQFPASPKRLLAYEEAGCCLEAVTLSAGSASVEVNGGVRPICAAAVRTNIYHPVEYIMLFFCAFATRSLKMSSFASPFVGLPGRNTSRTAEHIFMKSDACEFY